MTTNNVIKVNQHKVHKTLRYLVSFPLAIYMLIIILPLYYLAKLFKFNNFVMDIEYLADGLIVDCDVFRNGLYSLNELKESIKKEEADLINVYIKNREKNKPNNKQFNNRKNNKKNKKNKHKFNNHNKSNNKSAKNNHKNIGLYKHS